MIQHTLKLYSTLALLQCITLLLLDKMAPHEQPDDIIRVDNEIQQAVAVVLMVPHHAQCSFSLQLAADLLLV